MRSDLLHAIRLFARRPFSTAVLLATLALGIGANAAIFSLVRAVLLRPLPYHEPGSLVHTWKQRAGAPTDHARHGILTGSDVIEWGRSSSAFESFAVIQSWTTNLEPLMDFAHTEGAERLRGSFVTANFFDLLGVHAALGRTFDSRDAAVPSPLVVVSDAFWRRRFGADPAIVGREMTLVTGRGKGRVSGRFIVGGVLPPGFHFTYPLETEVWAILPWEQIRPSRALEYLMIARLKPGASIQGAQAELTTIQQNVSRAAGVPERSLGRGVLVESLAEHVAAQVRPGVLLLIGGAIVVLAIACVNVALLLLTLITARQREMAIRTAMGAPRARILRQLLAESTLLSGVGAALGVGLAWLLLPALRAVVPTAVPRGDEIAIDPVVLAFACGAAILTAVACGLAPVWHARRRDVQVDLARSNSSATADRRVGTLRRGIVALQVAVVLILLVTASLLLHSFWRMQRVDLGFDGTGVITMEMRLLTSRYGQPVRLAEFQRAVMEHIRALPGVQQASMTSSVPLRGVDFTYVVGPKGGKARAVNMRPVDAAYFSLMRIPLLAGRTFTDADTATSNRVAVISEAYSRALFGEQSAIGRQLELDTDVDIVGVVKDVRHRAVKEAAQPALYLPRTQEPNELICLVIRPVPGAIGVATAARAAVRAVDPEQPVERVTTLDRIVRDSTAEERFYTITTTGFAGVAVLLAVAGLSGVVSRTVIERARELAVRTALGARPAQLVRLTVTAGMLPVAVGLGLGLVGAWGASRLLARFLFEISPLDPWAYALASLMLAVVAALACYVPARRSTCLEPMTVLKGE